MRDRTKEQRLITLKSKLLYKLHRAQNCCPACTDCRNVVIDAIMDFARHYAVVINK